MIGLKNAFREFLNKLITKRLGDKEVTKLAEDLMYTLIQADVGYEVAEYICNRLQKELEGHVLRRFKDDPLEVSKKVLKSLIDESFKDADKMDLIEVLKSSAVRPFKILFLGVNGVGKTTTIAKLAYLLKNNGFKVLLSCADTFRAGAIEQLKFHAAKIGVPIITHTYGADPTAVAYDAVEYAKAKGYDIVMIDTAGRQHTNVPLVEEMKKLVRVIKPDMKVLVIDALTGNDAITQAKEFDASIGVDGVIFTKVDADARGGTLLSVAHVLKKPILYIGVGQRYEDLRRFNKDEFIRLIVGE
ncbi:MAG: signal recognition particle-docking protein FtsY [Candidatus Geothermarchaeota archaeon]